MNTEVTCYTELIAAIEAQRQALGIKQTDFDELCDFAEGLWGKAAGMLQAKRLGPDKIFDGLRGAGLRLRVEIDPQQLQKMQDRIAKKFNPRNANQARPGHSATPLSTAVLSRVFKALARNGTRKRWARKSKAERSAHMRMMALAKAKADRKKRKALHRKRMRDKQRRAELAAGPARHTRCRSGSPHAGA